MRPHPHHSLPSKQARIVKYLQLGWQPDAITRELSITLQTIYNAKSNIVRYKNIVKPLYTQLRQPLKFTKMDKEAVLELLL